MRPSPTAGQASLEYVAVISLVAAVLVLAAPAVGSPSIAGNVARAVRQGVCVVAHDVCSSGEAAAAGLAPCQLSSATRGGEASVTVFSVEIGGRDELTGTRSSDGGISLAWTAGGSLGAAAGAGIESPFRSAGVGGALRAKVAVARGWRFPDEATARRFVAGMPASAADQSRWPAAWHSVEGSVQAAAALEEALPGLDLAAIGVASDDALGARFLHDGTTTLYFNASFEGPEAAVPFFPSVGRGKASVVAEYTLDRDGPRELAFRQVRPSDRNSRITETVTRLDLRDPRNAGQVRWPQAPRKVLDQMARAGTVERNVYSLSDRSRGASGSVALGIKFGASGKLVDVRRTLIDASARTRGSAERSRFDCLDRPR